MQVDGVQVTFAHVAAPTGPRPTRASGAWTRQCDHNQDWQLFRSNTFRHVNVLSRRARGALGSALGRRLLVVAAATFGARRVVLRLLRRLASHEHCVGVARAAVPLHGALAVGRVGDELTVRARRARVPIGGSCGITVPKKGLSSSDLGSGAPRHTHTLWGCAKGIVGYTRVIVSPHSLTLPNSTLTRALPAAHHPRAALDVVARLAGEPVGGARTRAHAERALDADDVAALLALEAKAVSGARAVTGLVLLVALRGAALRVGALGARPFLGRGGVGEEPAWRCACTVQQLR